MPRETMTGRERWLAVLRREKPDRIPMDYWGTGEASEKLVRHLGCKNLDEALARLHVDAPYGVGGRYVGPAFDSGTDMWGFQYVTADYGTGVYSEHANHPLARFSSESASADRPRLSSSPASPTRSPATFGCSRP